MARQRHSSKPEPRYTPERALAWFPVFVRYGALIGVAVEAIISIGNRQLPERPYLLALYGAMLGLTEIAEALRDRSKS
jgi:hypothetical protein